MYTHVETDLNAVGLHDRRATHIDLKDGVLGFDFPDGFFILTGGEPYRSGMARMECSLLDNEFFVSIFTERADGSALREDFTGEFIDAINSGRYQFEFVSTYLGYESLLFRGYVWFKKRPYHKECEIEFRTDDVKFFWNDK